MSIYEGKNRQKRLVFFVCLVAGCNNSLEVCPPGSLGADCSVSDTKENRQAPISAEVVKNISLTFLLFGPG